MIAIADYGLGNVQAISNIYKRMNIPARLARCADELFQADRIILPGVGAFDWALTRLSESGMREPLDELVVKRRRPILGICVGMQVMARCSAEGALPGLGWIDADVVKFDTSSFSQRTHLPHMGWNDVAPCARGGLFEGLDTDARFYFLHSYYFVPHKKEEVLAVTEYNGSFASAVASGNIYGVQFHPEKSHQWGIRLLKNFAEL